MINLLPMMMNIHPQNVMSAKLIGNPTVIDNRVSGFSDSNYLKLNTPFNPKSNDFEIVFSLTTGNSLSNENFFFTSVLEGTNKTGIRLGQYAGKLFWTAGVSDSNAQIPYSSIFNPEENPDYVNPYLQTNTSYKIKYTFFHNGEACIYLLVNNEWVWVVRGNFGRDYSNVDFVTTTIGCWINSDYLGHYWNGTIDLNHSYITINNTKYRIIADTTMYALIQGSPTVQDGRVSGFSSSNYLKLQQNFVLNNDTVAEFITKININNLNNNSSIIGTPNYFGFALTFRANGLLLLNYGIGGSNWTVSENGSNILSTNTDYYIRLNINKGSVIISYSTDNINYMEDINTNINFTEQSLSLCYGVGRKTENYLRGSIDLNRSYIKIDDTKYKLQAVVGYTIVGSPTITDGVVSGFSSANYLTIANFPYVSANNWEIVINANTTYNSGQSEQRALVTNQYFRLGVVGASIEWNFYNGSSITWFGKVATTYSFIKLIKNNNVISFYVSTDGEVWEYLNKTTTINSSATDGTMYIGAVSSGWLGSINLNNTYIKINNKLWFNGQQA